MADTNPYKPPVARVDDVTPAASDGRRFIADGRGVAAGQGWAWIAQGWDLFKRQPGTWVLILIVLGVIMIAASIVPLLNWILPSLLIPGLSAGVMLGCRALENGERLAVGHVFDGFKARGTTLLLLGLAGFALYLIAMIPLAVVLGAKLLALLSGNSEALSELGAGFFLAILLTLAISIPVYMALWFAPALIALNEAAPLAALRQSFGACLKNIVPFLLYGIVLFGLGIVAAIPFGLGLLVLMPVLLASVYMAYRDIFFEA